MANTSVYPYGTGGSLPTSIGLVNDLTTGGVDKALTAEQGKMIGQDLANLTPVTKTNTNPFYPGRLAVENEDYTVILDKTAAYNGSTLTDSPGGHILIIKMRGPIAKYSGQKKTSYYACWYYSAEPDPTDYTENRIRTEVTKASSKTLKYASLAYVLLDLGTDMSEFKLWFANTLPEPVYRVDELAGMPVNNNVVMSPDENIYGYDIMTTYDGTNTRYEIPVPATAHYFVMWNDSAFTPQNANGTWLEYDELGTLLRTENAYSLTIDSRFGNNHTYNARVRLSTGTRKLVIFGKTSVTPEEGGIRFYVNADGHLTRFRKVQSISGVSIQQEALTEKKIVCFGDSITHFGSAGATGGWPFFLQKYLDNGIFNYAQGNATLADWSNTDVTDTTWGSENGHNNTVSRQIRHMISEGCVPDIAIINGGVNDVLKSNGYSFDLDTALAAYPNTTAAVYQNVDMLLCYAISNLRYLNPNVKIYLSTPTFTLLSNTSLATFADNIRAAAKAFGCGLIDFQTETLMPYPTTVAENDDYYDDVHPSQLGVNKMGALVMSTLKSYSEMP